MQSVGTRLREAREKKGFSLDEINARTRITSRNLQAIELDEVQEMSSPFIYRSFVRQIAEQVDLDFRLLAPAVEMLAGNMRQPDLPGQGKHQPLRVATIQARPKRDFGWALPTAAFLGIVALGSGGFAVWKYHGAHVRNIAMAALNGGTKDREVQAPAAQQDASAAARRIDVPKGALMTGASPVNNPSANERIHLKLAATERTWVTVSADGKPAYTGILEAAQVKTLDGEGSAKLRTGNAGGVNITFNGKDLGAIGPHGKIRTVVFSKTGYEVQPENANRVPADHIGG